MAINLALVAENSCKVSWRWSRGYREQLLKQPLLLWPELETGQWCGPGDVPPRTERARVRPHFQPHMCHKTCPLPSSFCLCQLKTGWTEAAGETKGKPRKCRPHGASSYCSIRCPISHCRAWFSRTEQSAESRCWAAALERLCWEPVPITASQKQK